MEIESEEKEPEKPKESKRVVDPLRHEDFDPMAELLGREKENKDRERAPIDYAETFTMDDEYAPYEPSTPEEQKEDV